MKRVRLFNPVCIVAQEFYDTENFSPKTLNNFMQYGDSYLYLQAPQTAVMIETAVLDGPPAFVPADDRYAGEASIELVIQEPLFSWAANNRDLTIYDAEQFAHNAVTLWTLNVTAELSEQFNDVGGGWCELRLPRPGWTRVRVTVDGWDAAVPPPSEEYYDSFRTHPEMPLARYLIQAWPTDGYEPPVSLT